MEVLTGALPSVIAKLGELLVGEYNLQRGVKGEIRFLQYELESMQGALQKVSNTPADQLDNQDKIWARDLRELSYDIEDSIDTFMVQCKGSKGAKQHGIKEVIIERILDWLMQLKIRRKIATDIRDIKGRVEETSKRRDRYKINNHVAKPIAGDPRLLALYEKGTKLVGIDEAREEVIKILIEGNEVSKQQENIVSIVGFGGLGKTTLANVVYEKLRGQFVCSAFVSVSQTPDMEKIFKGMLCDLGQNFSEETLDERQLINKLRELLQQKRCPANICTAQCWAMTMTAPESRRFE